MSQDSVAEFEKGLQEFAKEVEILCALEAGGKIEPADTYRKIKSSWKRLKSNKKENLPKSKAKSAEKAPSL